MTKLEAMLKYVSEHNDFYKKRIKEYGITNPLDITQWPVLTRKELQENRYNMFSDGYKAKYFNQQLRRQSSSGSSGVPVNVYWDYKDWYASNKILWKKRLDWYGIYSNDRYVIFTLNAFNVQNESESVFYRIDPQNILTVNVSLIQKESAYERLIDIIDKFNPKWFYIQPFVLNKLIKTYIRTNKKTPKAIAYIETVGELSSPELRQKAIEFFDVPLANMYGSEEMNSIAYECPKHHMHLLNDNIYVNSNNCEQAGLLSNKKSIIITNLLNKAMPLINYDQGDIVAFDKLKSICPYDKNDTIISLIKGRIYECIRINECYELNPTMLLEIMAETINQYGDIILSYQFIYEQSRQTLVCLIETSKYNYKWFPNIKKSIEFSYLMKVPSNIDVLFKVKHQYNHTTQCQKQKIIEIIQ